MRSAPYVVALVNIQVCIHITLVRTPNGAGHAGPGLLEGKDTLNVVPGNLLSGDGINNGGLNAEEGKRGTAGLGGGDTTQRGDHVRTGLGLPVSLVVPPLVQWISSITGVDVRNLHRRCGLPPFQRTRSTTSTPQQQWAHQQSPEYAETSSCGGCADHRRASTDAGRWEQRRTG